MEEVYRMALLSLEQRQRLGFRPPEARVAGSPWLQLYARLTAPQRDRAESEQGLQLGTVPMSVRLLAAAGNDPFGPRFGSLDMEETLQHAGTVLKVTRSPAKVRPMLTFQLQPPPGQFRGRMRSGRRETVSLPFRDPRARPAAPASVDVIR